MPRVKSASGKKKQNTPASRSKKAAGKTSSKKGKEPAHTNTRREKKETPKRKEKTRNPKKPVREYKVSEKVQAKWGPLSDSTRAHVLQASESAVNGVLAGSIVGHGRADTHKHLQELQNRVSRELEGAIGPVPAKKRRLSHAVLLSANKRAEDTLLATYRQISHLERELAKETEQMEEDDTHLKSYVSRMKDAKAHHKHERSSKLHPQLRKAPKPELDLDDAAWMSAFSTSGGSGGGSSAHDDADVSTTEDDDVDQDLVQLQTTLYQTLGGLKSKATSFQAWLSTVHSIAALTTKKAKGDEDDEEEDKEGREDGE